MAHVASPMITIATLLWDPNRRSKSFSAMYDEAWVEKLYRGFARNLTWPFQFVCFTDRDREFAEPVEQFRLSSREPGYADCLQPFEATRHGPMILVGLDTIVCGAVDHLAAYAETADVLALPRDPYNPAQACNGVCLIPGGHDWVWSEWDGQGSDMDRCRAVEHVFIDDLFPGQVQSFKGAVRGQGIGDTRICYFHGEEKPHQLPAGHALLEHWR